MGIFNLFNKKNTPLQVGETRGDRIGCYLFGIEMPDGSDPSYHSLAVNREELLENCMEFFNQLADKNKALVEQGTPTAPRHAQDLKVINNAINNLPMFIDMHLKQNQNNGEPFLKVAGITIFLRTGERQRQKIQGKYIE